MQTDNDSRLQSDEELAASVLTALVQLPDPLLRYEALTRAQAVYEALVKQIAAERARSVADMHDAGMSYGVIAEAIGFTRSRAQQLVERAEPQRNATYKKEETAMASHNDLTEFLNSHVSSWPRPTRFVLVDPMWHQTTAEQVAVELLSNAEFRALQLGTWLNTPDGELILAAVEAVSPPLVREDVALLANAVQLAAEMQQGDGRKRAVTAGLIAAAGVALLVAAAKS